MATMDEAISKLKKLLAPPTRTARLGRKVTRPSTWSMSVSTIPGRAGGHDRTTSGEEVVLVR